MTEFLVKGIDGELSKEMIKLYNYFSLDNNDKTGNIETIKGLHKFPNFVNNVVYDNQVEFTGTRTMDKMIYNNNNKVLIGYSSGFDSTYIALNLLSKGLVPVLFHLKSLNKSYPDEYDKAVNFAKEFGLEIIVVEIQHGKQFFIDNPIKNQMILSLMMDYGFKNNINQFAMGNNVDEDINECRIQYGISDSINSFNEYRDSIGEYVENVIYHDITETKTNAYKFLWENYPQAFKYVNSCITPHRFKKHLNKLNSEKFNYTPLSDTRCMSCFKCAIEYITLDSFGFVEKNDKLLEHCYNVIRKKSDTMFTTKIATKKSTNEEIRRNILSC